MDRVRLMGVLRAALAGWAGMTGLIGLARLGGLNWTDIVGIEGAFFAEPRTRKAFAIGSAIHLGMCLWIAAVYRLGFRLLGWRPSWRTGLLGGLIHWFLASLVAGWVSAHHPRRAELELPGYGGIATGVPTVAGWLISHLVFGVLVGHQYGRHEGHV